MLFSRKLAAGVLMASIAVLAIATPVSAHDQLVQSTPESGEQLDVAPHEIQLRFSGDLLQLDDSGTGTTVLVVDESGRDWTAGTPALNGDTITVTLAADMPSNGYQVRWQVVSEDGHPIAGVVPFTIGDAEPFQMNTPDASSETNSALPEPVSQGDRESETALRTTAIALGGAVVAGVVFALINILVRRRTTRTARTVESHEQL